MALAITTEQEQLVDAVTRFAGRHAPIDKTRASADSIAAGETPTWWEEFTAQGFHAVHLPDDVGGQGGGLADMACVVEAAAAALLPGPLLATATASAVAALADAPELLTELAHGATAAVVLPEQSDVRATADGGAWRLSGSTQSTLGICAAQRVLLVAHTDSGELWFALDTSNAAIAVTPQEGTDLCTDVGELRVTDLWRRRSPESTRRGPAVLSSPSPRVRPLAPCAGARMRPRTTSGRVNSSAGRSAHSRPCSTRRRCCGSTPSWPRPPPGMRCAPTTNHSNSTGWQRRRPG